MLLHLVVCNSNFKKQLCMANQFSMLGYGDIIIPGFLGGYCAYFDMVNKHAHYYYYFMFIFSYGVGLILTFLALILSGQGQPALFFLVPCTLGSLTVLAYIRGELRCFWNGPKFKARLKFKNTNVVKILIYFKINGQL